MNNDTIERSQDSRRTSGRRWFFYTLGAVVIVSVIGAGIFLILTHRVAVALGAGQQATVRTVVCGTDVVEKYKKIYFPLDNGDSQAASELTKIITSNPRSSEDPTCQTILFWLAQDRKDVQVMEASLATIKRLHGQGVYADSALRDGALNYLEDAMKWNSEDTTTDGQ